MSYKTITLENVVSQRILDDKKGWINFSYELSEDEIDELVDLICKGCHHNTKKSFRNNLPFLAHSFNDGIYSRVIKTSAGWQLFAAQDYIVDRKGVRDAVLKL